MSDQITAVLVGGLIGISGSIIGALVNHWLALRRDRELEKLNLKRALRSSLTQGASRLAVRGGEPSSIEIIEELHKSISEDLDKAKKDEEVDD